MECEFCGRDLSGDSSIKILSYRDNEGEKEKYFCDGDSVNTSVAKGKKRFPIIKDPESKEGRDCAEKRQCARAYSDQLLTGGIASITNTVKQ